MKFKAPSQGAVLMAMVAIVIHLMAFLSEIYSLLLVYYGILLLAIGANLAINSPLFGKKKQD